MKGFYPAACDCEIDAVLKFVTGPLQDHENEHADIFRDYTGVGSGEIEIFACGGPKERTRSANRQLRVNTDDIAKNRREDIDARSDNLDPYEQMLDFSPCGN